MSGANLALKAIMEKVYQNRHPLPDEPKVVVRHEVADGKPMCEVWFMTNGCSHDRSGGCTMCNYGKGKHAEKDIIIPLLSEEFSKLPAADTEYNLVVNPSGSFLDDLEVQPTLRGSIYELLDRIPFGSLTVESRADVINSSSLRAIRMRYPNKKVTIEIGVETLNTWLLINSVNKGICASQIEDAVKLIHNAGLAAIANIGIGLPFLSERANIAYSVSSIIKAIEIGFDSVILFPYHVKPGTLLEALFKNGSYRCVSLWSVADVLLALPKELLSRVNISWHRNYYVDKSKVLSSPDTCPACRSAVLNLLDSYKSNPSEYTLSVLNSRRCECRDYHESSLKKQHDGIDFQNVQAEYNYLGETYGIDSELLSTVLKEMRETIC